MNRREFLAGIFATGVIASLPAQILTSEVTLDWQKAIWPIMNDYMQNIMIFGIGMLEYTEEFPFIRSVHPKEIYIKLPTEFDRASGTTGLWSTYKDNI